jgi:sulfite oxidase
MNPLISRRHCLKLASASLVLPSAIIGRPSRVTAQQANPGSELIVRTETPFNAEPPLGKLAEHWLTPTSLFFVRSHGTAPRLELHRFSVAIDGMVEKPLSFSVRELLDKFGLTSVTATLTCSGNRRTEFNRVEKVPGVQWDAGAIGNAEWRGVRLSDVLKLAGVKPEAKHVWFEGLDSITEKGETFPFGGSIPLEKAMSDTATAPGCLLATMMNGKPLTTEHGFPLRTIVPGFIGARSVKWLSKITVSDQPSPNHYLAHAYKLITEDTPDAVHAAPPIYEYLLNSIICSPATDTEVSGAQLAVKGVALPWGRTGSSVKRVELSTDGGETWLPAKFTSPVRDYCWVHWAAEVPLTSKSESLLVRAIGSDDQAQPRETPWNMKGYQYNGWHKVTLKPKS